MPHYTYEKKPCVGCGYPINVNYGACRRDAKKLPRMLELIHDRPPHSRPGTIIDDVETYLKLDTEADRKAFVWRRAVEFEMWAIVTVRDEWNADAETMARLEQERAAMREARKKAA